MISATITGNIGQDARLGNAGETPVVNFSVASKRHEKGEDRTDWVDVAFFGMRATKLAQYLTKGSRVCIRGTVHIREYAKKDGTPGVTLSCKADDIELMGKPTTDKPVDDGSIPF